MNKEDYTLEYYLKKDKERKERNHALYLKQKYKLTPEEYETVKEKRKSEVLSKVLEMCQRGLKNRDIAVIIGIQLVTVFKYKRILRDRGFYIEGKAGRPSIKTLSPQSTDETICENKN